MMHLISTSIGCRCLAKKTACPAGHTERLLCSSRLVLGHAKMTHDCLFGIASGKRLQHRLDQTEDESEPHDVERDHSRPRKELTAHPC